jgi:hypothetical protein
MFPWQNGEAAGQKYWKPGQLGEGSERQEVKASAIRPSSAVLPEAGKRAIGQRKDPVRPLLFHETPLAGAYVIELEKQGDDRGFFARAFCRNEFERAGLTTKILKVNNSLSVDQGTLRGMHYQLPPYAETKIVRCIRGALWDCILDLRPGSATFRNGFAKRSRPIIAR